MTGNFPSFTGRKMSARSTNPSSIVIGTSQSIRMPSRISVRCCNDAITPSRILLFRGEATEARRKSEEGAINSPLVAAKAGARAGYQGGLNCRSGFLFSRERAKPLTPAPFDLGHLLQHGADRGGITSAETALHCFQIDALGCVEYRRRYANFSRVVADHLHILVPH